MKYLGLAMLLIVLATKTSNAAIVITEIMYNPASVEADAEWVEIYNNGPTSVDLTGWYLDDEDNNDFGLLSGVLNAGQVGIIHNEVISSSDFASDWGLGSSTPLFAVTWGSLANSPSPTNEVLTLFDSVGVQMDLVNYDDEGDWPVDDGAASIYLTDLALDNNLGSSWDLSTVGVDGGRNPFGTVFSANDVGSPGFVNGTAIPEPGSFLAGLAGIAGIAILSLRRKRLTKKSTN